MDTEQIDRIKKRVGFCAPQANHSCRTCKHANIFGTYCRSHEFWLRVPSDHGICKTYQELTFIPTQDEIRHGA